MERISFVGLGTMGLPMVRNLARAGASLAVFDADEAVAANIASELDARRLGRASDAAETDVLVVMLPNSSTVQQVLGDQQDSRSLAGRLAAGTLVVDMGSSSPETTAAIGTSLASRDVALVDAPVSGGPTKATTGELTIMAGGAAGDYERALPILQVLGASVTHVGPVGAAHALKALNNLLSAIGLAGALEVLTVGKKFGLDPQVMLDVINHSTGRNQATEVKVSPQVLEGGCNVGFSLPLTVKDITTALELARSQGLELPLAQACVHECDTALEALRCAGKANPDQSELARYLAQTTGTSLLPERT